MAFKFNEMKDLTISLPDEIYDSVVNLLKQIPNVILNEEDNIPQWHKDVLDSRYADFLKNTNNGSSFLELKSRLLSNGKISGNS
ncbi:hypothetical protein EGI22_09365 [Lacihabitans sp. LS3-19]|nr:hypothetical protein [Lacihabitans sp. LS3-19]